MPIAAPRPCTYPGCSALCASGRCDQHRRLDTGAFGDRRRGSRHERGYGTEWDHTRERILRRDGGLCQPCKRAGLITAAKEVDHVVAKGEGGTDADSNLQAICVPCHRAKTQQEALRARGIGVDHDGGAKRAPQGAGQKSGAECVRTWDPLESTCRHASLSIL